MNHILTFNVGNFWHPNARASVVAAAARWGCELHERNTYAPASHPFAAKFHIHKGWPLYDRVLYLDADIVVRADCPSPFDLVPERNFGAVRNAQDGVYQEGHEQFYEPYWRQVCERHQIDVPFRLDRCLNGGFLLWTRGIHDHIFEANANLSDRPNPCLEQIAHAVMLAHFQTPVMWLPQEFNRVGPAVWTSGPRMTAYVYHFANYLNYRDRSRIGGVNWEDTEYPIAKCSSGSETASCGASLPTACLDFKP